MNYFVVCKSDNKTYLLMTEVREGGHQIAGFTSKEEVMKAFKGYTEAWTRDATWNASATIGMMSMQPHAIEAIDIEELKKYLQPEIRLYHITGGAMNRGYKGILINEDILKLPGFDIWKESMELAGIM